MSSVKKSFRHSNQKFSQVFSSDHQYFTPPGQTKLQTRKNFNRYSVGQVQFKKENRSLNLILDLVT